jgi:hypothetical protein
MKINKQKYLKLALKNNLAMKNKDITGFGLLCALQ